MIATEIECPGCAKRYRIPEEHAGKLVKCKKCGASFAAAAPAPAADAPGEDPEAEAARAAAPAEEPARPRPRAAAKPARPLAGRARMPARPGARRSAPRPAPAPSAGGSFLSSLKWRLVGGVAVLAIILGGNFFFGSAAFDAKFAKVAPGMSVAQVVAAMGQPGERHNEGAITVLGFEAVDRTGRHTSRSTFYIVALEDGRVVKKERVTEAELKRRFGQ